MIAVAVYGGGSFDAAFARSAASFKSLLLDAAPGDLAVMAHTTPDLTDRAPLQRASELGLRLWLGAPSNQLVALAKRVSIAAAMKVAGDWLALARSFGCECLVFNGERGKDPTRDWIADTKLAGDVSFVRELTSALVELCRSAPPLAIGFTSHDMPQWFALAWDLLLGRESSVDLNLPQHYPADGGAPEGFTVCGRRLASSQARWLALVKSGKIDPAYASGGAGYLPYGQLWGLTAAGCARILDAADGAAGWALPELPRGRTDALGLQGLRAVLRARKLVGPGAQAITRYQEAKGLRCTGKADARTLGLLGLE